MKKLFGLLAALGAITIVWRWRYTEPSRRERVLQKSRELADAGGQLARSASTTAREKLHREHQADQEK